MSDIIRIESGVNDIMRSVTVSDFDEIKLALADLIPLGAVSIGSVFAR